MSGFNDLLFTILCILNLLFFTFLVYLRGRSFSRHFHDYTKRTWGIEGREQVNPFSNFENDSNITSAKTKFKPSIEHDLVSILGTILFLLLKSMIILNWQIEHFRISNYRRQKRRVQFVLASL